MTNQDRGSRRPLAAAFLAYTAWGLLPLYWKALKAVDSLQILSFRILLSLLFVWIILAIRGKPLWPRVLAERRAFIGFLVQGLLIAFNWGLYIWAVNAGHTVEASLGYYINPLLSVVLGILFLKERLSAPRMAAFLLASAGVIVMTLRTGRFPWVSLSLAVSFGLYGLAKKTMRSAGVLETLGAETLILAPAALALLGLRARQGALAPVTSPVGGFLLAGAGVVTALPLLAFALAARGIPLSALGFIQFISPTITLAIGVLLFHESFGLGLLWGFVPVWASLAIYLATLRPPALERSAGPDALTPSHGSPSTTREGVVAS